MKNFIPDFLCPPVPSNSAGKIIFLFLKISRKNIPDFFDTPLGADFYWENQNGNS